MQKHNLPEIISCTDLKGKYVLVRVSLNVPVKDGVVLNAFRIQQSLPTITYLRQQGAKVILCSHIGKSPDETLAPVHTALLAYFPVQFSPEVVGEATTKMRNALQDGEVLLLENVRRDSREIENDPSFAKELSLLAEVFVNDDFAASHRAHASLHAICALLPSYVGINFAHEYTELSKAMTPESPSLFMIGGAKFETKMPLVEKYLPIYDHVFIGGALANDFFKGKGLEVGTSLVSKVSLVGSSLLTNPQVLLPVDVTVANGDAVRVTTPEDVHQDESILDAGPKTIAMLARYMADVKTILWNGPLGNYENGFQGYTIAAAKCIADSSAYSVIGGGDTVASIETLNNQESYDFLSTAGGAMLTFLELGSLPALDALLESRK